MENLPNPRVVDLGNNESMAIGVARQNDGFVALTFTQSKSFKTYKGAVKWLEKRGYGPDGNRLPGR